MLVFSSFSIRPQHQMNLHNAIEAFEFCFVHSSWVTLRLDASPTNKPCTATGDAEGSNAELVPEASSSLFSDTTVDDVYTVPSWKA